MSLVWNFKFIAALPRSEYVHTKNTYINTQCMYCFMIHTEYVYIQTG